MVIANPYPLANSGSAGQLPQKFLLVHAVLEGFAAVDEDDGDLVVVEAPEGDVGVDVDFAPVEAAAFVEFDEALLDDFAEMTALAGIDNDFPLLHMQCSLAGRNRLSKTRRA
jgi:hypothetical protein